MVGISGDEGSRRDNTMELQVLVVDDDRASRLLACRALEEAGFQTLEAADGEQALALVYEAPERIGAVVLDVLLPSMGGFQVLESLRGEPTCSDIPVVLLTARANEVTDVLHGIEVGADDHVQKPFNDRILAAKVRALCERRRGALELSQRLRKAEALAATDPLTSLGNRRAFESQLQVEISYASRSGQPLSLLLLDIDHFKPINDRYGHPEGDRVLVHVARCIRSSLRVSDQAYRVGGEEFAALLRGCDASGARVTAQRVLGTVSSHGFGVLSGESLQVTLSAGLALMHGARGLSGENLVERADKALYRAKSLGRARVEFEQPIA